MHKVWGTLKNVMSVCMWECRPFYRTHELDKEMRWKEHHWLFQKAFFFCFKPSSPSSSGCREEVSLAVHREEYLKKESTDTHKEDTDVQIKRARQEEITSKETRCRKSKRDVENIFCISKLPSMCSWKEATLDASHSVWPQASVS